MVDPSLAAGHMRFSGSFTNNRKTLILKHDLNLAMREYMSIQKIQQTIGNFLPLFFISQDLNTSLPLALGDFSCKYSRIRSVHGVFCWSRSVGHWVSAPRGTQEVLSDYFQCGTSLEQAIIILTHCLFLILAGLQVIRISMVEHASHRAYTPLQKITSANLWIFSPVMPSSTLGVTQVRAQKPDTPHLCQTGQNR